jgi:IPT/TIG domain
MPRPIQPRRLAAPAALIAIALAAALPSAAQASTTTLSNVSEFEGGYEWPFGDPNTATYGEVVTVPAGQHQLRGFTFYLEEPTELIFRAYVYKWNGTRAVGEALYEGPNLHSEEETSEVYVPVHATTPGVQVAEGQEYVLFFSISKNKAEDKGSSLTGKWATVESAALGHGVYINNGYQPRRWTEDIEERTPEEEAEEEFNDFNWSTIGSSFEMTLEYGEEPPVVTSVSPTSVTAGTTVTITGSEFNDATEVLFGSTPATSFTIVSDGEITAVAPAGLSGTVDVTVVDRAGRSATTAADRVNYLAPTSPTTSTTTSTTTSAAKPVIVIKQLERTVKHGKAKVALECTAAPCHGWLSLAWLHREGGKTVTTLLSRMHYTLAAGEHKVLTVRLTREARKLLRRHHRLNVRVRASDYRGTTVHRFSPLRRK